EFRLEGVTSNLHFLQNLLQHPEVQANRVTTGFIETHAGALTGASDKPHPHLFAKTSPLSQANRPAAHQPPAGSQALNTPVQGVLVSLDVQPGDSVSAGQQKIGRASCREREQSQAIDTSLQQKKNPMHTKHHEQNHTPTPTP